MSTCEEGSHFYVNVNKGTSAPPRWQCFKCGAIKP